MPDNKRNLLQFMCPGWVVYFYATQCIGIYIWPYLFWRQLNRLDGDESLLCARLTNSDYQTWNEPKACQVRHKWTRVVTPGPLIILLAGDATRRILQNEEVASEVVRTMQSIQRARCQARRSCCSTVAHAALGGR